MRTILSSLAFGFLSFVLFQLPLSVEAADSSSVFDFPLKGDKPGPVLQKIQAHLSEIGGLRANFQQTKRIAALTRPLSSRGEFLFSRGRGAIWRLQQPYESLFVVTPSVVRQSDAAGELANMKASQQPVLKGFTEVFLGLLTGDIEVLKKQFQVYFTGGASDWTMGLTAKDSRVRMFIEKIVLSGGSVVQKVQIFEKTGDSTTIDFSNVLTQDVRLSPEEQTLLAG